MLSISGSSVLQNYFNGSNSLMSFAITRRRVGKSTQSLLQDSLDSSVKLAASYSTFDSSLISFVDLRERLLIGKTKLTPIPVSVISASTFTENKKGNLFFHSTLKNTICISRRGFKISRKPPNTCPSEASFKSVLADKHDIDSYLSSIIGKLDTKEREKLTTAVLSYSLGLADGKKSSNNESFKPKEGFFNLSKKLAKYAIIWIVLLATIPLFTRFTLGLTRLPSEIKPEDISVTFDDIKGCDEAKEELQEIVQFLQNPEKFSNLGGKLPKGCLLVGPPGTGKTLLARAVAGEALVPFFNVSGSEFDELFVGQGAKRIRDLFRAAKSKAPCVIFIDEIDSVGSTRKSTTLSPYANQTINQLLSEMDGFVCSEGVIVLGATNRAEDLDKALTRPGRFDTRIYVGTPDIKGRKEILKHYCWKIKHDLSVDIDNLGKRTPGFTGADLENLVNTAALRGASLNKDFVTMEDFEHALDKIQMGSDLKSRQRSKEDLKITAVHEAGHTIVAFFSDPPISLHKVTIVAKGQTGGHTALLPNDSTHQTKAELLSRIDSAMGGRAAEEYVFGKDKITTGAHSDLETATRLSKTMVTKLGMSSKMGLRVIEDGEPSLSPAAIEIIDKEVDRILNESYKRALNILKTHHKELELLSEALIQNETLDLEQIKSILGQGGKEPGMNKSSPSNFNSIIGASSPVLSVAN